MLLSYVEVYELGEQKNTGTPVVAPSMAWAPAENMSQGDLSRDEILNGAFGK